MGFFDSVRKAVEYQQDEMARSYRKYEKQGAKMAQSSDPRTAQQGRAMQEKSQQALDSYDNILAARSARKERQESEY